MRFLLCATSILFSLSVNALPLAWADNKTLPKVGTSIKTALENGFNRAAELFSDGAQRAGSAFAQARLKRMQVLAEEQWAPTHKKRFLRTKVNMMPHEKPDFILFFAHGYRPKTSGYGYAKEKAVAMVAPFLRSFRYVMYHPLLSVGPAYTTFAQKDDIDQVKFHLDRVVALVSDPESAYYNLPIICVGHSNGAATLIALLGTYPDFAKNISVAVLFAPYADVRKTRFFHNISEKPTGSRVADAGPRISGIMYDPKQKSPIDFVNNELFPRELPTFLVHAEDDAYIPLASNFTVFANAFKKHNYEDHVHLFAFERGGHGGFLAKSQKEDRKKLRSSLKTLIDHDLLRRPHAVPLKKEKIISEPIVEHMLVGVSDDSAQDKRGLL